MEYRCSEAFRSEAGLEPWRATSRTSVESTDAPVALVGSQDSAMAGTTFPITSETATVPTFSEPVVQLRLLFMMPR